MFIVNMKQSKISDISIRHMKADSFQKNMANFRKIVNIKLKKSF